MASDPIFIVGTERSGSNLLRMILHAHTAIAVPHPPHILHYFAPLRDLYGDPPRPRRFERLVDDVLGLLAVHIHPWDVPIDRDALLREAHPRDLFGVFYALYDQVRRGLHRRRWGCKSTFVIHHVERIRETYPEARFVWLVRDPRDVAASSRRSVFSPCHPWHTARLWSAQQRLGLDLQRGLPRRAWHRLRYEDLLDDPEGRIRDLCAFLDEPFEEAMLSFHRTDAARRTAALSRDWRNTAAPVLRHNAGKYRQQLSSGEIRWVEAACGDLMRELGYAPDTAVAAGHGPGRLLRARFAVQGARWRAGVEWRSLRHDANHWRRWRRDAYVAALRLRRRPWGSPRPGGVSA